MVISLIIRNSVSGDAKKILLSDDELFVADLTDKNVYGKKYVKMY